MSLIVAVFALEALLPGMLALASFRVSKYVSVRVVKLFALAFGILTVANLAKLLFNATGALGMIPFASPIETAGFFFLALAYVYSVRRSKSVVTSSLVPYASSPLYVFSKGVSLYLILYSAVEITIFFIENRNKSSLLVSIGLYLLFIAQAVSAFTSVGITNPLLGELISLAGYSFLSVPGLMAFYGRVLGLERL